MTAVQFDPAGGRLRLDQPAFERLVEAALGGGVTGPELAALRDSGVIEEGGLHPLVADAMRPVTAPVCRLSLILADEEGRLRGGDGWLAADGATLLLDLPEEGLRDLVSIPTDLVPAAIARLVRLGPRPRPEPEPLAVSPELLAGLLAADPDQRRRAAGELAGVLPLHGWRTWLAQMAWNDPRAGVSGRDVQVVDAKPGLYLVASDPEETALLPTTPTAVWRMLTLLLPNSDEVG